MDALPTTIQRLNFKFYTEISFELLGESLKTNLFDNELQFDGKLTPDDSSENLVQPSK